MLEAFLHHLEKHRFPKGKPCLLAVSGGIDSMVMCHLFHEAGLPFAIAHCNFQLRGKDSEGDENFVAAYAKKHGIPFYTNRFSIPGKSNIQETARHLRYEWLEVIRKEHSYTLICTAHHLDDSIETLLFHILRGTGIAGLRGIPIANQQVFRPLLFAYRAEIDAYAKRNKIKYRTDKTNARELYQRNRIRKYLVPLMEKIQPGFRRNAVSTMEHIAGAEQVYKDAVWSLFNEITELKNESVHIHKAKWLAAEHRSILLFEYLSAFGFNAEQVRTIAAGVHAQPGRLYRSATHSLLNDRTHLILSPLRKEVREEEVLIREDFSQLEKPLSLAFYAGRNLKPTPRRALLDRAKLRFPLLLRPWKAGDYFYPTGMSGRKKLSDLLTDLKVPRTEKQGIFVITSGEQIVWVVGMRVDRRFASTEQTTDPYCVELK